MSGTVQVLRKLPEPTAAWFDPKTGKPTQAFFEYMRDLDQRTRDQERRIAALEP